MGINTKLDDLFKDWKKKYRNQSGVFVKDGIVNETLWDRARSKILFFLKEPNLDPKWLKQEPQERIEDFRLLCDRYPWRVPGQWAYGLLHEGTTPAFCEAGENYGDSCRSVAFMNAKKMGGGVSANMRLIYEQANSDAELLREELDIINPGIVLCCGKRKMFALASEIFPELKTARAYPKHQSGTIYGQCFTTGDRVWIDFVHPSMRRVRYEDMYNSLCQTYKNAFP
jgi:hypothetical protein